MRICSLLATATVLLSVIVGLAPGAAAGPLSAGVHGNWGSEMDFGVGARVTLGFDRLVKGFEAVGSFDYFFPGDDLGVDVTYWEINTGFAYRFKPIPPTTIPYLGIGLNLARFEASTHVLGADLSGDEMQEGASFFGGLVFGTSRVKPFVEGRFTASDGGQFVASAGVLF